MSEGLIQAAQPASAGTSNSPAALGGAAPPKEQVVWLYEARKKIYPRAVSGWFARWRVLLIVLTQLVFYGAPWLLWNDRPALLFDLATRRFYLFGYVFWPQDFIYLTGLLVVCAYALFFFTAVAGRLWCGYACPQTVYTEMFMYIERWIEGDANARRKLDAAPWSLKKVWRKAAKQGLWITLALWTGVSFVGYFVPIRELVASIASLTIGGWALFWVLFYAFATWGNAGFMREQVCKYMCPYARFQSAMLDKHSLIITYDTTRGEPRGSRGRKVDPKQAALGDCIDCGLCVAVCPTGIDIRKGLQYECIGCAGCIDVCDEVMSKMNYAPGLIRYATEHAMTSRRFGAEMWRHVFRMRTLVYGSILVLLVLALGWGLANRTSFKVDVVRDRNALARLSGDGSIENVYRLQIMNTAERPRAFLVDVAGLPGIEISSESRFDMLAAQTKFHPVRLRLPESSLKAVSPGSHAITFTIRSADGSEQVTEKAVFYVARP
jgi:cytochrome c oxidase accessory protein FixG